MIAIYDIATHARTNAQQLSLKGIGRKAYRRKYSSMD